MICPGQAVGFVASPCSSYSYQMVGDALSSLLVHLLFLRFPGMIKYALLLDGVCSYDSIAQWLLFSLLLGCSCKFIFVRHPVRANPYILTSFVLSLWTFLWVFELMNLQAANLHGLFYFYHHPYSFPFLKKTNLSSWQLSSWKPSEVIAVEQYIAIFDRAVAIFFLRKQGFALLQCHQDWESLQFFTFSINYLFSNLQYLIV